MDPFRLRPAHGAEEMSFSHGDSDTAAAAAAPRTNTIHPPHSLTSSLLASPPPGKFQLSAHPSLGARSSSRRRGGRRGRGGQFIFSCGHTLRRRRERGAQRKRRRGEDPEAVVGSALPPARGFPVIPCSLQHARQSTRRSMFSSSSSSSPLRRINGRGLLLTRNMIGFCNRSRRAAANTNPHRHPRARSA